jgi:hypothetical protein
VTWHDSVMTSVRGEATPGRRKGGDDVNLTRPKNEKNHTVDLAGINGQ